MACGVQELEVPSWKIKPAHCSGSTVFTAGLLGSPPLLSFALAFQLFVFVCSFLLLLFLLLFFVCSFLSYYFLLFLFLFVHFALTVFWYFDVRSKKHSSRCRGTSSLCFLLGVLYYKDQGLMFKSLINFRMVFVSAIR